MLKMHPPTWKCNKW